jgi:cytosine/adenosine deaminase-related metal-dependent hydrolase
MADLVSISLDSARLAGPPPRAEPESLLARIVFAASPADVDTVVVGGRVVVEAGEHSTLGPSKALADRLGRAIAVALGAGR